MQNKMTKKAIDEIKSSVENKFPNVKFEKATEWHNADIAISFITPNDNGWEISEFTSSIQLKYLEEHDLDIVVLPLEELDGNQQN